MDISVLVASASDLLYIDSLQRKNAEQLSFYPKCVFEREVDNRRILLARVNGEPAGYLYHGSHRKMLKIHQACIEYDLRGQAYGARLVAVLLDGAKITSCEGVSLRCGSDIEANGFWRAMGFSCIRVSPGGVRRMRDINTWYYELQPALFSFDKVEPSEKSQDASAWRKRNVSLDSQFLRGQALADYRAAVLKQGDSV